MTKTFSLLLLFTSLLFSCTNGTPDQAYDSTASHLDTATSLPVPDYDEDKDSVNVKAAEEGIPVGEYLTGRWQSIDDTTNIVVFDGNLRSEKSAGMKDWDRENFVLSDRCANTSNNDVNATKEKDHYISCLKSDMCWYIISIDKETLSLSYMGRGNTLTYKRMEDDM